MKITHTTKTKCHYCGKEYLELHMNTNEVDDKDDTVTFCNDDFTGETCYEKWQKVHAKELAIAEWILRKIEKQPGNYDAARIINNYLTMQLNELEKELFGKGEK